MKIISLSSSSTAYISSTQELLTENDSDLAIIWKWVFQAFMNSVNSNMILGFFNFYYIESQH